MFQVKIYISIHTQIFCVIHKEGLRLTNKGGEITDKKKYANKTCL